MCRLGARPRRQQAGPTAQRRGTRLRAHSPSRAPSSEGVCERLKRRRAPPGSRAGGCAARHSSGLPARPRSNTRSRGCRPQYLRAPAPPWRPSRRRRSAVAFAFPPVSGNWLACLRLLSARRAAGARGRAAPPQPRAWPARCARARAPARAARAARRAPRPPRARARRAPAGLCSASTAPRPRPGAPAAASRPRHRTHTGCGGCAGALKALRWKEELRGGARPLGTATRCAPRQEPAGGPV
jgi:hypothetical protein